MVCIYCSGKTKVTNSRTSRRTPGTWRRRQCLVCQAIFTSRENADLSQTHIVKRQDGSLAPFSRDVLFISVYESCRHRKTAPEDATALVDTIVTVILQTSNQGITLTSTIINTAQGILRKFDPVAATYYGAYYA